MFHPGDADLVIVRRDRQPRRLGADIGGIIKPAVFQLLVEGGADAGPGQIAFHRRFLNPETEFGDSVGQHRRHFVTRLQILRQFQQRNRIGPAPHLGQGFPRQRQCCSPRRVTAGPQIAVERGTIGAVHQFRPVIFTNLRALVQHQAAIFHPDIRPVGKAERRPDEFARQHQIAAFARIGGGIQVIVRAPFAAHMQIADPLRQIARAIEIIGGQRRQVGHPLQRQIAGGLIDIDHPGGKRSDLGG